MVPFLRAIENLRRTGFNIRKGSWMNLTGLGLEGQERTGWGNKITIDHSIRRKFLSEGQESGMCGVLRGQLGTRTVG